MTARIITGDVFAVLPTLTPGSVDCCVTSVPYWMLRSYLPADHPLKHRELGGEKTIGEYVERMVQVFRYVRGVLADHAVCFLNVGDSYVDGALALVPQRLALGLQTDGWMVRSVIVWCLAPGTVLYAKTATTEGPMTLHDLVRLDPSTVQLWTGEKWSRVLGWSPSQAEGALRFTLRSGETISCTAGHQWPLADGRLVRAEEIR